MAVPKIVPVPKHSSRSERMGRMFREINSHILLTDDRSELLTLAYMYLTSAVTIIHHQHGETGVKLAFAKFLNQLKEKKPL